MYPVKTDKMNHFTKNLHKTSRLKGTDTENPGTDHLLKEISRDLPEHFFKNIETPLRADAFALSPEEKIMRMQERKTELAGAVIEGDDSWLGNLSEDEIRELFA